MGSGSAASSADADTVVVGAVFAGDGTGAGGLSEACVTDVSAGSGGGAVSTGGLSEACVTGAVGAGGLAEACCVTCAVGAGGLTEVCFTGAAAGAGGLSETCVTGAAAAGGTLRAGGGGGLAADEPAAGARGGSGGGGGRGTFPGGWEERIDIAKSLSGTRRTYRAYLQVYAHSVRSASRFGVVVAVRRIMKRGKTRRAASTATAASAESGRTCHYK
jgi:hypothetical protein